MFASVDEAKLWAAKLKSGHAPGVVERRRALTAVVWLSDWRGPEVLAQCQACDMAELESFVRALESGEGAIPLRFRWASDADCDGAFKDVE
jgi:hypothetical protein